MPKPITGIKEIQAEFEELLNRQDQDKLVDVGKFVTINQKLKALAELTEDEAPAE